MSHGPRLRWRRVTFDAPYKQDGGFVLEELVDRKEIAVDEGGVVQFEHDVAPFWRPVEAFGTDEVAMNCSVVVQWPDAGTTLVDYDELDRNRIKAADTPVREVDPVPNKVEADPTCQAPGCYHRRSAHRCEPGVGAMWKCLISGCLCENYREP